MSLRSLFLAGRDAYQATAQLDSVTTSERLGMVAAPAFTGAQDWYWRGRGEWVLDTGRQQWWEQDGFSHWSDALQAAYNLPEHEQTLDVVIRCRANEGGGVNVFDTANPESVQSRLERLEQEVREGLARDGQRHELGAEGSPTGKTGWSYSKGRLTRVTPLDAATAPAARAQIAEWNKFRHPLRPTVQDAKAEGRELEKAVTRRRWAEVIRIERRP